MKLGYGGTKEEMQRLLEDAEKFSGVKYDISSLADVYEAIHVVQTELDITGTTAKEASTTISGSVASMKSAWENLVVGIADENANFEVLVSDFVDSLVTVGDNLIPRIEQTLSGVGTLLTSFSETILPKVIDTIVANLPKIIETGITIVIKLIEGLAKAIPQLVQAVPEIVESVVKTIIGMLPELVDVGKQMVLGVWEGIKGMARWFKEKVSSFFNGVVDNVKGVLGIHSPSRVFAGIGENMALGLGKGWESEYNDIKNGIESGLNFGSGNVKIAKPNYGQNGMYYGGGLAEAAQDIVLNITNVLDGKAIGETAYRYSLNRKRAYGV